MSLETATYINQLDAANPLGSDPIASGDDHIRLLKSTIKATFPNITGVVSKTHTEINTAVDQAAAALPKAGGTLTGPLVLSGDPSAALNPATKQYTDAGDAAAVASAASSAASLYPTKAGSGATGTWAINISGNAATATSATTATTAANGGVTSVNGATGAVTVNTLGNGQTWQDLTSSRVMNTSYQNTTGRPISVNFALEGGAIGVFQVSSDNSTWVRAAGTFGSVVIPTGHYYRVYNSTVFSVAYWSELR